MKFKQNEHFFRGFGVGPEILGPGGPGGVEILDFVVPGQEDAVLKDACHLGNSSLKTSGKLLHHRSLKSVAAAS